MCINCKVAERFIDGVRLNRPARNICINTIDQSQGLDTALCKNLPFYFLTHRLVPFGIITKTNHEQILQHIDVMQSWNIPYCSVITPLVGLTIPVSFNCAINQPLSQCSQSTVKCLIWTCSLIYYVLVPSCYISHSNSLIMIGCINILSSVILYLVQYLIMKHIWKH